MYLVAIGWMYVVLMMALAEALSSNGTVLGGIITFVLYGLLPMGLLLYILGTPFRRKAMRAQEASAVPEGVEVVEARAAPAPTGTANQPQAPNLHAPDRGSVAAGGGMAAERKET